MPLNAKQRLLNHSIYTLAFSIGLDKLPRTFLKLWNLIKLLLSLWFFFSLLYFYFYLFMLPPSLSLIWSFELVCTNYIGVILHKEMSLSNDHYFFNHCILQPPTSNCYKSHSSIVSDAHIGDQMKNHTNYYYNFFFFITVIITISSKISYWKKLKGF